MGPSPVEGDSRPFFCAFLISSFRSVSPVPSYATPRRRVHSIAAALVHGILSALVHGTPAALVHGIPAVLIYGIPVARAVPDSLNIPRGCADN